MPASKPKPKSVSVLTDTGKKRITLSVKSERTPFGEYYLYAISDDIEIPYREIIALAQRLDMPILFRGKKFFPEGKMAIHFIKKN